MTTPKTSLTQTMMTGTPRAVPRFIDVGPVIMDQRGDAIDTLLEDRELKTIYGVRHSADLDVLLSDLTKREYATACKAEPFSWHGYRVQYVPDKYVKIQGHGRGIKINTWEPFFEGVRDDVDTAQYMKSCADTERDIYDLCGLQWHPAALKWHSIAARSELFLAADGFLDQYRQHPGLPAYYGPRIEQAWQGIYDGPLYHYDIHAAYPFAMSNIRPFTGPMQPTDRIVPGTYGFYLCRWDFRSRDHAYNPFPVRQRIGDTDNLVWPATGTAWVSCFELEAYTALYGWDGIKIIKGYAVRHDDHDGKLQADIRSVYRMRLERPTVFIKKFMASMYGKTIQQAGHSQVYNPFYAALVTGYTRAQLIPHLSKDVISILADSIISKAEVSDLDVGRDMGQWDRTEWMRGVFVKTGIYQLFCRNGSVQKLRGFQDETMNCERVYREALRTGHFDIHMRLSVGRTVKNVCVRNTLRLNKRTGAGLFHNRFGNEALTYYPPARGSRVPSLPYTYGGRTP